MRIPADPHLFWFLKEGSTIDLDKPSEQDMYLQHTLCRGMTRHIKELLHNLTADIFKQSFSRTKHFLPKEVRNFWEDYFAGH